MLLQAEVSAADLRRHLADVLNRVQAGERITVTRGGELAAVLMPVDDAAWAATLADRFRSRERPFTQEALDAWVAGLLDRLDLSDLFEPTTKNGETHHGRERR